MKVFAKLFLSFFVLFVTGTFAKERSPNASGSSKPLKGKIFQLVFEQKLDHYDSTDTRKFNQRYFVYKGDGYVEGNPVFLLVGGVCELELSDVENGMWNHYAIESNALLLGLEHRMYGKSYLTNEDFSTKNLAYLNSEQALADLAFFIDELVLNNPKDIKISKNATWIAFGSIYGGTLAVLLKMKFSHKVKAVVAANAPLLPTSAFEGFYSVVEQQCKKEKIDKTIKEAFNSLQKEFNSCEENKGNRENHIKCVGDQIKNHRAVFNFCSGDLSIEYDAKDHQTFLFWSLATIISLVLHLGNESERKVKTDVIKILLNERETPLNRLGAAVKKVLGTYKTGCLIVDYKSLIDSYKDTSPEAEKNLNYILNTGLGSRQLLYQHCSEWGQFETAYKNDGLFAKLIPLEYYLSICSKVFGPEYDAEYFEGAIKRTDMFYGGWKMNVSNVLFITHGHDFWSELGFLGIKERNEIQGQGNVSVELAADSDNVDQWKQISRTLKKWSGVKTTQGNNV